MIARPLLALALALLAAPAFAAADLKVCLNEAAPPYSFRAHGGGGFDLSVAKALAGRLDRALDVRWFESKLDEDSSSELEANALLSDGVCDLVAGYPLTEDSLERPGAQTAKLPDFDGLKPADRKRRVPLGVLRPTRAYHFAPLAVILGPKAGTRTVAKLADLQGVPLGVEDGTLADVILMRADDGKLIDEITHYVPGRDELWPAFERGDFAATLTPLHRFDAYRASHPGTALRDSGYRYPIGFNIGFVGLAGRADLIAEADKALSAMLASGELAGLARASGMSYAAPHAPDVGKAFRISDLKAP
jgi:ABC-type amino acid transport substrate-binding protein